MCATPNSKERFKPGDHLAVSRWLYHHHDVYVGDDRVVQFGGRILGKHRARIEEVSLAQFERGGVARVVDHTRERFLLMWGMTETLPPQRIVARARCLVETQPHGVYNLLGRNCETVALWCATGVGESMQRQRFQVVNATIGAVAALYTSWLLGHRRDRLTPRRITLIWAWTLLRMIPLGLYYLHNYRFYRDVRGVCDQV
jgi:hypothetical protein